MRIKGRLPAVETGPAAAEVPAGPADMPGLLGMLQDPQPALNLAIFLGRRRHPPSPIGLSNGMSRKIVDIADIYASAHRARGQTSPQDRPGHGLRHDAACLVEGDAEGAARIAEGEAVPSRIGTHTPFMVSPD